MLRQAILLLAATLLSGSATANEAPPPPGFDPASVPEHLRVLEGRTAFIKSPDEDEAPLNAAEGAVLKGNVPAQIVTSENTTWIPIELASKEREFDRFVQGYISEADLVAFMEKQTTPFVMLEDGAAVRIIAPNVNDGFAT